MVNPRKAHINGPDFLPTPPQKNYFEGFWFFARNEISKKTPQLHMQFDNLAYSSRKS